MELSGRTGVAPHLLLTGASGFLGKVVLEQALRRDPDLTVTLIMRPRGVRSAAARFRSVSKSPCFARLPADWTRRVEVVEADLSQPKAGLTDEARALLAGRVTHLVNCAASITFDLPMPDALRANVESALNVMELARACTDVRSVVNVSTAYVTPHRAGAPIDEELPPLTEPASELYDRIRNGGGAGGGHEESGREADRPLLEQNDRRNSYILTKSLCEHLLVERYADLPLTILRPSIISAARAEPFPGWIDSGAAFAAFVYLVGSGQLQELIGDPQTRLDIVPCDVVAAHILGELFDPPTADERPQIRHSTAGREQSATIAEAADEITRFFHHYPVDNPPQIRYLGPNPHLLSLSRAWGNALGILMTRGSPLRKEAREKRRQADEMDERFRYFMLNTFEFRSSLEWPPPPLVPREYLRTICRGVYRHIMQRDERELLVAGRRHGNGRHDRTGLVSRTAGGVGGGVGTRFSLSGVRTRLARWADRITIDEPSLIEAREQATPGSLLIMHPLAPHSMSTAALLSAYALLIRPNVQFGSIWVLPEDRLPLSVSRLLRHGPESSRGAEMRHEPERPRARGRAWVIAARDDADGTPAGTVYDGAEQLNRLLSAGAALRRVAVELTTVPDEDGLTQREDSSMFLIGRANGAGGTRLLRQLARSLPQHHAHVRSVHLRFRLEDAVSVQEPED